MRTHPLCSLAVLTALAVFGATGARAQTDIGVGGFANITQTASGNGMTITAPSWFGGVVEMRHIISPLLGFEGSYSVVGPSNYDYATSVPVSPPGFPCTPSCSFLPPPSRIQLYTQTISGAWVPSMKIGNLRPFALLGAGVLIAQADNGQVISTLTPTNGGTPVVNRFPTSTRETPAYVYGAGVDWGLLPRIGLRLQYRGEMYKAPNVAPSLYPDTNSFIQTAEPTIGIYFRL